MMNFQMLIELDSSVTEKLFKEQFGKNLPENFDWDNDHQVSEQVKAVIGKKLTSLGDTQPLLVQACKKMVDLADKDKGGLFHPFYILMSKTLTLLENPTDHKDFYIESAWKPEVAASIKALEDTARLGQELPKETQSKLSELNTTAPEFSAACIKLFDLLLTLKNTKVIKDDQYKALCAETTQLMTDPEKHSKFAALAKKSYSEVAGGKLTTAMLWVSVCAAKFVMLIGCKTTGEAWMKHAKEQLHAMAEVDKLGKAEPLKEETANQPSDLGGEDPDWSQDHLTHPPRRI